MKRFAPFFTKHLTNVTRNKIAGLVVAVTTGSTLFYMSLRECSRASVLEAEEKDGPTTMLSKYNYGKNVPLFRIVLTGGPCAGKSSAMMKLSERLKALGFEVFIVTEVATLLHTMGVRLNSPDASWEQMLQNESVLLKTKMSLEDGLAEIARASKKPTIILCDRGVMDSKAFLDENSWHALLDMNSWTTPKLRDSRYDCVIHMVTAALGAKNYYTLANNESRKESPEEAIEQDLRLREAYVGHPSLFIVDNRSSIFEQKIQRVLEIVLHRVGLPRPTNYRRKFLIQNGSDLKIEVPHQECEIEQVFLQATKPGERRRIVKRGQQGVYNYAIHHTIISDDGTEEATVSRPISAKTYSRLSLTDIKAHCL